MKKIVLLVVSVFLFGCTPKIIAATPRSIMMGNVRKFNVGEAFQMAESECTKYNRHAVFIPDNVQDGIASYECKE